MSYTVNQLITNAFSLSKVRSMDFQNVTGSDITIGLDLLNKVLAGMNFNQKMIPFYKGIDSDYKNWNRSSND